MNEKKKSKLPFFARYLKSQELAKVGGGGVETQKFPSDSDEPVTQKYPSDGEDDGGGGKNVTLKYPSDSDESGATE